jgi:outer membrane protein OmpA-like peptidoglycan-associated protein
VIRQLYDYLVQNKNEKFEISGHTDNDGSQPYNLKLSQQRAEAVMNQLVAMGIDKSRLTAKGYGQSKPIDTKNTAEAKAMNRRVEFTKL